MKHLVASVAFFCASASAQTFPSRPVLLVVPFTTGTGIDILARVIGPRLSDRWKQPVVVENKPGASGNLGSDFVAKAAADGHTLMVTVNTYTITPALFKKTLPYDPVADIAPVSKIALATYTLVVNPTVFPGRNMQEAIAIIRTSPRKYNFASPGSGTPHHVGMELIKQRLGLDATHVPYKGFAGAMNDLVGGQVHMMFTLVHSSLPHVRSGRIRALAVTGAKRSPQYPEAPTFREQGIDFMDDVDAWYAVMAPGRTSASLVARLNADVNAVIALPEVQDQLLKQGMIPVTSTPGELAALIKSDLVRWAKVVADARSTSGNAFYFLANEAAGEDSALTWGYGWGYPKKLPHPKTSTPVRQRPKIDSAASTIYPLRLTASFAS